MDWRDNTAGKVHALQEANPDAIPSTVNSGPGTQNQLIVTSTQMKTKAKSTTKTNKQIWQSVKT